MKRNTILAASFAALALSGCAGSRSAKKSTLDAPVMTATVEDPALEASSRGKEAIATQQLETVRFSYDDSRLSEEARNVLAKNASFMKSNPELEFVVEGHCDSRGTIGYNLALGQRRAYAVRDYYKTLGVKLKRLATVSWGEERPVCETESEDCWGANRRASTAILRPGAARR